jgi:hypothetical protein
VLELIQKMFYLHKLASRGLTNCRRHRPRRYLRRHR